jgi:hypothetical protein
VPRASLKLHAVDGVAVIVWLAPLRVALANVIS